MMGPIEETLYALVSQCWQAFHPALFAPIKKRQEAEQKLQQEKEEAKRKEEEAKQKEIDEEKRQYERDLEKLRKLEEKA